MTTVCKNKRAYYDYEILDKWEAGLVLSGLEVKAFRGNQVNLQGAWIKLQQGELFLVECHVSAKVAEWQKFDPVRPKKLLLRKSELIKIQSKLVKGLTLVPLEIYFNSNGYAKLAMALAQGKKLYDKRKKLENKISKREAKF